MTIGELCEKCVKDDTKVLTQTAGEKKKLLFTAKNRFRVRVSVDKIWNIAVE